MGEVALGLLYVLLSLVIGVGVEVKSGPDHVPHAYAGTCRKDHVTRGLNVMATAIVWPVVDALLLVFWVPAKVLGWVADQFDREESD